MTIIKQVAVTNAMHAKSLSHYLDDGRVLCRRSQHIINEGRWWQEMEATRQAYGHDRPSRAGAKNTIILHQILSFNPDECHPQGGPVTPEFAMKFAGEYVSTRYPDNEAIWVLHEESGGRYSVHIALNRTVLTTGLRLNEGRSRHAKIERANTIRDMDRKYGLRQVEPGMRNSRTWARMPTKAEREMEQRGVRSDKQYIRDAIKASVRETRGAPARNRIRELAKSLDAKGVTMSVARGGKDFTFERRKSGLKVNGVKLGRGYSMSGITRAVGMSRELERDREISRGMSM